MTESLHSGPEILPAVAAPGPDRGYYKIESHRTTFVYFIQAVPSGAIKIGKATNVKYRMSSLISGTWEELRLVGWTTGGISMERELQRRFSPVLIRREWFSPDSSLIEFIKGLR